MKIERETINTINEFKPDLLFVGFGAPKQEKWVARNKGKLNARGIMVVGGALDYIAGRIPRAPQWVQNVGFEWLFRLMVEPWRWKRQFVGARFFLKVVQEGVVGSNDG